MTTPDEWLITDMNKRQEELMGMNEIGHSITELDVPFPWLQVTAVGRFWTGLARKFRVNNQHAGDGRPYDACMQIATIPKLGEKHNFKWGVVGQCTSLEIHPNPHVENCYFVTANYVEVKGDELQSNRKTP